MKGDKSAAYIVSDQEQFKQLAEAACAPWVDIVSHDASTESMLRRLANQFIESKIAPKLIVFDAALSEGVAQGVSRVKDEHTLLYVLVAGAQMPHEITLDVMRAQADNCIELESLTANYVGQLQTDILNRESRNSLQTIYQYIEKKKNESPRASSRRDDIQKKFSEFGFSFDDFSAKPGTVLVVDDEADNRFLVSRYLQPLGYHVLEAENGQKALDMLVTHPEIDVVLLDVRMPIMSGDVALGKMKELAIDAEVVMLTAFKDKDVVVNTFRDDAFDYINKPLKSKDLVQKVAEAQRFKYSKMAENLDLPIGYRKKYLTAFMAAAQAANKSILNRDVDVFIPELFTGEWAPDDQFNLELIKEL